MTQESQNILERQRELEKFLRDLDDIRKDPDHMLSPIAGYFEKIELNKIDKILEAMGYPTSEYYTTSIS